MGLEFNFCKYILNEMVENVEWKKKEKFLMYPRFLQLILNIKHPDIERNGETLDVKSLGSNTFGPTKQNRKGKFMFQGKYSLVKFGNFAEVGDVSSPESSSDHIETKEDVITVFDHEEERVPPVTIVAEEHDHLTFVEVQSDYIRMKMREMILMMLRLLVMMMIFLVVMCRV